MMPHNSVMRTTVNVADHLLIEAKRLAAVRRTSLAKVVEDSLRRYLAAAREERAGRPVDWRLPVIDAGPPVPGVDLDDTSELLERR